MEKVFSFHTIIFLIQLLIVLGWGGVLCNAIFEKYFSKELSKGEKIIISIGIAPYLITLILYYLFLLIPSKPAIFYTIFILLTFLFISIFFRKELKKQLFEGFDFIKNKKIWILLSILFLMGWTIYINMKSFSEHDILEYAVQGKIFFKERLIQYSSHRIDEASGFYYVGLHGFSFPLLATFEHLFNQLFSISSDLFFRSLNSIFGILILLFSFQLSKKKINLTFALFFLISLAMTYGFFETVMKYHIDLFRIFYILVSIYLMYFLVNQYNKKMLILTTIFIAAQANAHSLGCMLSVMQLGLLFIFLDGSFNQRLQRTSLAFFIFIIFGGLHYILDVSIGTGWIFQEIKFY